MTVTYNVKIQSSNYSGLIKGATSHTFSGVSRGGGGEFGENHKLFLNRSLIQCSSQIPSECTYG